MKTWVLRGVDTLLTEAQRHLPPDEFQRYRVLVGAALLNFFLALSLTLSPQANSQQAAFRVVGIVFLAAYLSTLLLVRGGASFRLPAMVLCATLTLGSLTTSALLRDPQPANGAAVMLIPALAVYLLGARPGLAFTALTALIALLILPLFLARFDLSRPLFPDDKAQLMPIMTTLSLLGGWFLSWLYSIARAEAHATLEQTLRTLRQSESRLVSLIESTEDSVCSLDGEGRILISNPGAMRTLRQIFHAEPSQGESLFRLIPAEQQSLWKERMTQALGGQPVRFELDASPQGGLRVLDISLNPIRGEQGRVVGVTLFGRDITAHKEVEARLSELHRSLLDVSRQAGKAEIATGILHNMGNTLNSVNVSVEFLAQRLQAHRVSGVTKAAELLDETLREPGSALGSDPKGQHLSTYLRALSTQLSTEKTELLGEVTLLREHVEHLKAVVSTHQEHAHSVGILEQVLVPQLIQDALRLHAAAFKHLDIQVHSDYAEVPPLLVDRHKLLQILLNLLNNARQALLESGRPDKQIVIRVERAPGERLRISLADNGVGIPAEHLPRLFTQGFTTRKGGYGFGLHSSALAASEMHGTLTCASGGQGQGATFVIELPLEAPREQVA